MKWCKPRKSPGRYKELLGVMSKEDVDRLRLYGLIQITTRVSLKDPQEEPMDRCNHGVMIGKPCSKCSATAGLCSPVPAGSDPRRVALHGYTFECFVTPSINMLDENTQVTWVNGLCEAVDVHDCLLMPRGDGDGTCYLFRPNQGYGCLGELCFGEHCPGRDCQDADKRCSEKSQTEGGNP